MDARSRGSAGREPARGEAGSGSGRLGGRLVDRPAFDASHPTFYHLTWVYSNADGASWAYIDTGLIRNFERDGITYISLSGRSTNVGPDNTGWIGHWELNTETNKASRVGRGVGYIDELACGMLT